MILIQFPDRETEVKGLAVLMSHFSGKVLRGGLHIVPEAALDALAAEKIPYTVKGLATYEHEVAALRGDAAATMADSVAALRAAYAEMEAGDNGLPARTALRETCQRLGLVIDA